LRLPSRLGIRRTRRRVANELPTKHHDAFRERLEQAAHEKAKGRPFDIGEAAPGRAPVIDLMEALQESLRKPPVKAGARRAAEASARFPAGERPTRKRGAALSRRAGRR
jgi:non-homologous end joining protein Ku